MEKENKNLVLGCKKCKVEFTLDKNDFSFYAKMSAIGGSTSGGKVPLPNVCPDCRFKMKAIWRNEITLYSGRKCDLCQKNIITIYNPKNKFPVYCNDCFHSDKWDGKNYQINYDKNQSFFNQFLELFKKIPKVNTFVSTSSGPNINSSYTNLAGGMKNCYLVFNGGDGQDIMYSRGAWGAREVADIYFGGNIERCYQGVNIFKSNGLIWGINSDNCIDSTFIFNCNNLNNCFGCVNLRNKSYCYFNEQLNKEEYFKRVKKVKGSYKELEDFKNKFFEFCKKFPHKENNNLKTINCNGDFLVECKNVKNSFEVTGAENSKNLFFTKKGTINCDGVIGYGINSELLLECISTGFSSNVIGSLNIDNCQNILYSSFLKNCQDCIGCDGLKNAKYFILNKQYEKVEYEKLKSHIIEELTEQGIYGLMMPPEISPFAYNETIAQDNMPLTKEEAIAEGFRWEDDIQITKDKETLLPEDIPDHINEVKDEITKEILKCIDCERNYKIIEQELLFYRKMILPIPRKCFFCRHKDRIKIRGNFKFFTRACDKCNKETYTNLTKEMAPIMYCEGCYKREIY